MGSAIKRLVVLLILSLDVSAARAERSAGPWTNLPICTAPGGRAGIKVIADGRAGAIIAWYDQRIVDSPTKSDIYVQAINAGGIPRWTRDGVAVCAATGDQYNVALASDGDGGAIAAWTDYRVGGDIYAQRVNSRGQPSWTPDGINIAPERGGANPRIVPDERGGAFIAWEDLDGSGRGIYAQHVDSRGQALWGPAGIGVCTQPGFHYGPNIVSDGAGGLLVAWTDMRQPVARIFAQHIGEAGAALWTPNGIPLCTFVSEQRGGVLVGDGSGGAIAVWKDSRKAGSDHFGLFAQRVDGLGRVSWDPAGVDLCRFPLSDELFPVACANDGGAIVAWHDRRSGEYDIYAQSVNASGKQLWNENGVAVCVALGDQTYPAIVPDEAGGALVTWKDHRAELGVVSVQHVNDDGAVLWGASGIPISAPAGDPLPAIASDGRAGAFVAWDDNQRGFPIVDVVAERITGSGRGGPKFEFEHQPRPSEPVGRVLPDHEGFVVRFSLPSATKIRSTVYDIAGREVRKLLDGTMESGEHLVRWDAHDEAGRRVTQGIYFVRVQTDQGTLTFRSALTR